MATKDSLALKRGSLGALVDFQLHVEKGITALKIRNTHLDKNGTPDQETKRLLKEAIDFKKHIILKPIATLLHTHPAYEWFSQIKGIGNENIAKVITLIDISRATKASSLWRYAGYGLIDGKPERLKKNEKLHYNKTLRMMCYRLGMTLRKAHGRAEGGTKFGHFYEAAFAEELRKAELLGKKVAKIEDIPESQRDEYMSTWHIHNRAFRKMIKEFLRCLWIVWRSAEGLPIDVPYSPSKKPVIDPQEMTDGPKWKERRKKLRKVNEAK